MKIQYLRTGRKATTALVIAICLGLVSTTLSEGGYITINQVNQTHIGDLVIVSGTTDLKEGTGLMVGVEKGGYGTGTVVLKGSDGHNRWAVPIDTSTIKPGTYTIKATEITGIDKEKQTYIFGKISASTMMELTGTFLGSDTPVSVKGQEQCFIKIDPILNRTRGDQCLITGKTNLSVGTDILWEIGPAFIEKTGTGNVTGTVANSQVWKGKDTNRISLALNTAVLNPGEYNVTASTIKGAIFSDNMVYGPVSGSTTLILKDNNCEI